ncbi:Low temperature viability protein [Lindgomyces ingoldianus]|uniref:Low temperature viability protein n=1 Tax=Lindgomyces ingoldianus TaxID=673940 RepID=A0ACB6R534_9PLEO|nr:Low temperature viability protein [Lindgomyces ingoldianus]KAF2474266.1 Low temperature viability protein [Lindgomyces ingoldianus]
MPRRKFIDKKNATTFHLVHRAQNDPRIHDVDAPDMVFKEVAAPNMRQTSEPAVGSGASQYSAASGRSKIKSRGDLEDEFGSDVRKNEGEAANYGIFYDDSEYDYMQHMRDLGSSGEGYFVDASSHKKGKGKEKVDLADALRQASLNDRQSDAGLSMSSSVSRSASDIFGEDLAPSEFVRKTTYQDQQNIPDAIGGFQPDMDPRLREVLEALEDDAYVDDEDDIFEQLAEDVVEVDPREWEASGWGDQDQMDRYLHDDGWETDDTIKASSPTNGTPKRSKKKEPVEPTDPDTLPAPDSVPAPTGEDDNAWLDEFNKFKKDAKTAKAPKPAAPSDVQSSILTGASALTAGGRKKKRKGAMTSTSGYSMTSSALHRTEGLTILDQRFDKIEEEYAAEELPDDASMVSGMSKMSGFSKMSGMSNMSEAPALRSDFDNIMDDFLGGYSMAGKRRVKKGAQQSGLEQLDEIRKGLGPARVKTQKA